MSHCSTIIDRLRQKGYRITPQREMIIQAIAHCPTHMSAEEIFAEMQKHTRATNIATVYRTLDMLWEEGLTCRNNLGDGRIVFATLEHGSHIHLVCRLCNAVIDAESQGLKALGKQLATEYEFSGDLEHISIFGICAECQGNNSLKNRNG